MTFLFSTVYCSYLVFQLFSHKGLYEDTSDDVKKSTQYAPHRTWKQVRHDRAEKKAKERGTWVEPEIPTETQTDIEANSAEAEEEEEEEAPKMSVGMTVCLLVLVTVVCDLFLSLSLLVNV
jgi:Ca2+:H+ antiporter